MKKCFVLALSLMLAAEAQAVPVSDETESLKTVLAEETVELSSPYNAALSAYSEYEAVPINGLEKLVPKKQHEEDPVLHYTMDITFPQITGNNLSQAAEAFNLLISKMVNNDMQQFKDSVKRDIAHMQSLPESVQHNSFKIDYDLDVIRPLSLVSVRLSIESMQAGRAHPFHMHRVLNYDLINNKELALRDLFKKNANYLQVIAKYSNKKLNEIVGEKDRWMIDEGSKPLAKNYKNWNIEDDAILITFDNYQVAPYVYGRQEIEIPYSELKNILSVQAKVIASIKDNDKKMG